MTPRCSVVNVTPEERAGLVLLTHTLKGKRRTVEYVICAGCEMKERRQTMSDDGVTL